MTDKKEEWAHENRGTSTPAAPFNRAPAELSPMTACGSVRLSSDGRFPDEARDFCDKGGRVSFESCRSR